MKWVVLGFFAAALASSLVWIDSNERRFTSSQKIGVAAIATTGWVIVFLLGYLAV